MRFFYLAIIAIVSLPMALLWAKKPAVDLYDGSFEILSITKSLDHLNDKTDPCTSSGSLAAGTEGTDIAGVIPSKRTDYRLFKVRFDKAEDVPKELKAHIPGEVFERSKDGGVDFMIALPNDNAGWGAWNLMGGSDGDDFGNTHGTHVQIGKDFDGYYMSLNYETNLYTQRSLEPQRFLGDGNFAVKQYFTEENVIQLIADNTHKGNAFYWKAGVGWQQLNSEKAGGLLSASGQQAAFHSIINDMSAGYAMTPENIKNGKGIREGVFGTLALGMTDTLMQNGRMRLTGDIHAETRNGTLPDVDYVEIQGQVMEYYQKSPKSRSFKAGVEVTQTHHADGQQTRAGLIVGVGGEKSSLSLKISKDLNGNPMNYVDYNDDDEITTTLEFKHRFGNKRRASKWVSFGKIKRDSPN